MRHLHIAEIRDSWGAWLSVSITFVVVNAFFAGNALLHAASMQAGRERDFSETDLAMNRVMVGFNYGMFGLVALVVIGSVTGLVVNSRRGSIARLGLAGASPGHIVATLMTQLAAVSLASALVGDLLALPIARSFLNRLARDMETAPMPLVAAVGDVLLVNLATAGVAMVGGLRLARRATQVPPVEALRQAQTSPDERPGRRWRMLFGIAALALVVLVYVNVNRDATMDVTGESLQATMQTTFLTIPLMAIALTSLSPITIGLLTRVWTRLVPGAGTWHLARNTVLGKMDRLTRTVVPVMLALGLFLGMLTMGRSTQATMDAMGDGGQLAGTGVGDLLTTFGGPLVIAISGGIGALLIMARQREAELALDGVLGATPTQRVAIPVIEALIITVTATLNAAALLGVMVAVLNRGLTAAVPVFVISIPWGECFLSIATLGAVVALCTLLPTLPSLRVPEPRIISRRVAA